MFENDEDLKTVEEVLGHSSIKQTARPPASMSYLLANSPESIKVQGVAAVGQQTWLW